MVGRAALNLGGSRDTLFFNGDQYANLTWTPGSTEQSIIGPVPLSRFSILKESGFSKVDAILSLPGYSNRDYYFSGSQCIWYDFYPNGGPSRQGPLEAISDRWPSLAKAGFDHVDAACIVPGRSNQAYFFSGQKYCRVSFTEEDNKSELLDGPKAITTGWAAAKFKSVDTVLPRPGTTNGLYVFSGDKYVEVDIVVGGYTKLVKGPNDVATDWPGLHKIGFY